MYKQSESASGNIAGGRSTGRQVDYCLFTLSEHVFQKSLTVHLLRLSTRAIYRERERDREREREREREEGGGTCISEVLDYAFTDSMLQVTSCATSPRRPLKTKVS